MLLYYHSHMLYNNVFTPLFHDSDGTRKAWKQWGTNKTCLQRPHIP